MKAKIEITSIGYETYTVAIDKLPSQITKLDLLKAKIEWCKLNDIEKDSVELPFHRIIKVS